MITKSNTGYIQDKDLDSMRSFRILCSQFEKPIYLYFTKDQYQKYLSLLTDYQKLLNTGIEILMKLHNGDLIIKVI